MIPRYTRPEMGGIWTDENKFQKWLDVEIATAEVEAEAGLIPKSAARAIRKKAKFEVDRILEIEREVRHDVIAFTTNVAEHVGKEGRYLHFGLTSNDVVDTAQGLLVREASALLLAGLKHLGEVLKQRALEFKHTPMIGRTHGIHAEPITFGCKIAIWYAENQRNTERVAYAAEQMRVGKISGAVGTYTHLPPSIEQEICKRLGLEPAPVSSQVIQRDRHAFYLSTLAVAAASLEKIALEVRGLQRTEVHEVEEYFSPKQKGSSAMPHKRNPVLSENLVGLARMVRAYVTPAMEDVALWHERDISHSSVERMIGPDATVTLDFALMRLAGIIDKLIVYPGNMLRNLDRAGGLVHSQRVLLALTQKGVSREDAYRLVQRNAMKAWRDEGEFLTLLKADPDVRKHLSEKELTANFDLDFHLAQVDAIFARVFGRA